VAQACATRTADEVAESAAGFERAYAEIVTASRNLGMVTKIEYLKADLLTMSAGFREAAFRMKNGDPL
jgi:hypothetical protein